MNDTFARNYHVALITTSKSWTEGFLYGMTDFKSESGFALGFSLV